MSRRGLDRWFWAILALAFVLRLSFVLVSGPTIPNKGGDDWYFLNIGAQLWRNQLPNVPASAPLHLLVAGMVELVVGQPTSYVMLRLLNVCLGTAYIGFIYRIGSHYFNWHVGRWAAFIMAISPIFIIETHSILTETPFLFLMLGAFTLYTTKQTQVIHSRRQLIGVAVLLGLATLTRAVALLLPFVFVIDLAVRYKRTSWRWISIFLLAYMLTVATWSVYVWARWQRFVIAAEGLVANVYLGTTTWCGPACVDQQAGITGRNNDDKYIQGTLDKLTSDLGGYLVHRIKNLSESLLQPHNTVYFPSPSFKEWISQWYANGHDWSLLPNIANTAYFWPKLVIYIFHYGTLLFGLVGMIVNLRRGWSLISLYGVIAYFIGLHTILTANPRYLLPIIPFLTIFAVAILLARTQAMRNFPADSSATSVKTSTSAQP